jgi:lambda repressor-like predicted transcriptional regulator
MKIVGMDVGSTTVKATAVEGDTVLWRDYQRHNTKQAEKVIEFLGRMEAEIGLVPGRDLVFFTGSGAGLIAPMVGGKVIQEVVAVAASVEKLHPDVHFVSEIGGEDMKTIFFKPSAAGKAKQVYMQSACSGGTGTFVEKTARKLRIAPEDLAAMPYDGMSLHKVSSKCGIFAETDANTLLKGGVPVEEIIASLFEAVVYQNLATLTKGNTPMPQVLLLGGPNLFFKGLQQAWRHHLAKVWAERKVDLGGRDPADCIEIPDDALYYAASRLRGDRRRRGRGRRRLHRPRQACGGGSTRASTRPRPPRAARRSSPIPTTSRASAAPSRRPRPRRRSPSSAPASRSSSAATSARPPPRPSCCRRTRSSSTPPTRRRRATRSRTPRRSSGTSAPAASSTSPASPSPATARTS